MVVVVILLINCIASFRNLMESNVAQPSSRTQNEPTIGARVGNTLDELLNLPQKKLNNWLTLNEQFLSYARLRRTTSSAAARKRHYVCKPPKYYLTDLRNCNYFSLCCFLFRGFVEFDVNDHFLCAKIYLKVVSRMLFLFFKTCV